MTTNRVKSIENHIEIVNKPELIGLVCVPLPLCIELDLSKRIVHKSNAQIVYYCQTEVKWDYSL